MVNQCKVRSNLPTSIKIRVDSDMKYDSCLSFLDFYFFSTCSGERRREEHGRLTDVTVKR